MENPNVRQLIDSLEVLTAVSITESTSLAESRERTARIEDLFDRRLSGSVPGETVEPVFSVERSQTQILVDQRRRRERAFLDACEALMHLGSEADLRSKGEAVFDKLRQIRMIDCEDSSASFPMEGLEGLKGVQDLPLDLRRRSIREAVQSHHESLRGWMHARQLEWNEKIERSDQLLAEALEEARSMLIP